MILRRTHGAHRIALRSIKTLLALVLCVCLATHAIAAEINAEFSIDDYFELNRIAELSLSSDGSMIAYRITTPSLQINDRIGNVYVQETEPNAMPMHAEELRHARKITWIPGTRNLAFLLSQEESAQVYSFDITSKRLRQYTHSTSAVLEYAFSKNGEALAWLSPGRIENQPSSLYERLHNGAQGIAIDPENTFAGNFIIPDWPNVAARVPNRLWIKEGDSVAFPVEIPGQIKTFYWAPDSSKLSIAYVADSIPAGAFFDRYTSLGIYDVRTRKFNTIARAQVPIEAGNAIFYSGGEWFPDSDRVVLRRSTEHEWFWSVFNEWAVFNTSTSEKLDDSSSRWREFEVYKRDAEPAFLPVDDNTVYSNRTIRARKSLYKLTSAGFESADITADISNDISHFQFGRDNTAAVFVSASMVQPPEIYMWREGTGSTQLTTLNQSLVTKQLPRSHQVFWKSDDGTEVQGWLLLPCQTEDNRRPIPLLTFVHGGPGLAITNNFALYWSRWPYPFEVLAQYGIAVFFPNYRGTKTFGHDFADPNAIDQEPVEDIISGIEHLISRGIADPDRLAISGHSHGAWLASYVMTKEKRFKAASLAEGIGNNIVKYAMGAEFGNREIQDIQFGASLYDDPGRYVSLSPDLHFSGLNTAVLFESGSESITAIATLGSLKAARRAGMPSEFVVYPRTGHNLRAPLLQKESASRNLDWFRFWLQGYEDPDPEKAGQYARWRKMRDERCVWDEKEKPVYCEAVLQQGKSSAEKEAETVH